MPCFPIDNSRGCRDPDNHASETYLDALGNTRYVVYDSGVVSGTLTPDEQVVSVYNALNEAQSVTTTDLAPQSGQTTTSVAVTMTYDDLGRLTQEADPDRGTHSYTYDPDGNVIDDATTNRTIGYNNDLLGRVVCVQSGAVTIDADGSCTSGTQVLVQNTYDSDALGTHGSSDFPIGRLTQSQSYTSYPEGGSTVSTQKEQYDKRGRVITQQLAFTLPSGWHVTHALPTYQVALQYNDADQLTTTTTSTISPNGTGYSTYQNYDSTTGVPVGLSTQAGSTPNLAALTYNTFGLVSNLTFQNGSAQLAAEQFSYDGDLRPSADTAVWQSGSGQSGQFFSETRSFDQASNLVSQTTTLAAVSGSSSTGGSETANNCYNAQNQLVWASNTQTPHPVGGQSCGSATPGTTFSGGSYTNSFVYTHLGQLWQGPQSGTGSNDQYLYCGSNPHQLTDIVPLNQGYSCSNLPSGTNLPYALAYNNWGDANSRTVNGQAQTLSYNKLDEMTEWQLPTTSQAWDAYDSSGERTLQRTTIGTTTTITVYAFGLEEYTYDGSGTLTSSTHYYSLDGRLIGELQTTGGGVSSTYFYLTDNLGSLLAVFNNVTSNAVLLSTQLYAPYGSSRYSAGPQLSTYTGKGYTGQYSDAVSGLDYYNARYYDPVSGVFLSADSVQGNDQGMNPYGYAGNNPTTLSDPSGHLNSAEAYAGGGEIGLEGGDTSNGGGVTVTVQT